MVTGFLMNGYRLFAEAACLKPGYPCGGERCTLKRMHATRSRTIVFLLPCLVLATCFVSIERLWPYTMDDAFISLRYARHLATGEGLAFNAGEPLEGYTNFLWTVMLAIPHLGGWDAELFAKAVGCGFMLATVGLGVVCVLRLGRARDGL